MKRRRRKNWFLNSKDWFQPFLSGTVVSGISKIDPKPLKKPFVFYPNKIGLKRAGRESKTGLPCQMDILLLESPTLWLVLRLVFLFLAPRGVVGSP